MTKRILVVLSEWGYWGEEFIGPLDVLTEAGYEIDFIADANRLSGVSTIILNE